MASKKKRRSTKSNTAQGPVPQKSPNMPDSGTPTERGPEIIRLNLSHYFLFLLIISILVGCYHIVHPYLHVIILASILATLFQPIHHKILGVVKGRSSVAATLSCLVLIIVVILPLMFMMVALIHQGIVSFNAINNWIDAGKFNQLLDVPWVKQLVLTSKKFLPNIQKALPNFDPQQLKIGQILLTGSKTAVNFLLNQGGQLIGNLSALIGKFFLMIFTFFFMVRDEKKIFTYLLHLIPLSASQEDQIMSKIKGVTRSVLLGTLVTALGQGMAGGIAFWIAGLPGLFWGMMMTFASLIPIVGTALIWVPAAGYLFIAGHWGYGLFMVLWCMIVVGMIDNFVRPLFMKESAGMNTLLIFFAILGGINYFGLIGLLYGPLIFGLTMVLLYIYELEFASLLNLQDKN